MVSEKLTKQELERIKVHERTAYVAALIAHRDHEKASASLFIQSSELEGKIEEHQIDIPSHPYTRYPINQITEELGIGEKELLEDLLFFTYGRPIRLGKIIKMAPEVVRERIIDHDIDIDSIKKQSLRTHCLVYEGDVEAIGQALKIRVNADVVNHIIKYDLKDCLELVKIKVEEALKKTYCQLGKAGEALGLSTHYFPNLVQRLGINDRKIRELKKSRLSEVVLEKKGDLKQVLETLGMRLRPIMDDLITFGLTAEEELIKTYVQGVIKENNNVLKKTATQLSISYSVFRKQRKRFGIDVPDNQRIIITDESYDKVRSGPQFDKYSYGRALFTTKNPNWVRNIYDFMERLMTEKKAQSPSELNRDDGHIPLKIYDAVGVRRQCFKHLIEALYGTVLRIGSLTVTRHNVNYLLDLPISKKPVNALQLVGRELDERSESALSAFPHSQHYPDNLVSINDLASELDPVPFRNAESFIRLHHGKMYSRRLDS